MKGQHLLDLSGASLALLQYALLMRQHAGTVPALRTQALCSSCSAVSEYTSPVHTWLSKNSLYLCTMLLGSEQAWARCYPRENTHVFREQYSSVPQSSVTAERGLHPCGIEPCSLESGLCLGACQHGISSKSAVQGLQQEVARRQMAVLDRTSASPDLPQTMHERQASLRCGQSLQHLPGFGWSSTSGADTKGRQSAMRLFEAGVMR